MRKKQKEAPYVFPKYYVFKIEDLDNCLSSEQREQLAEIMNCVQKTRLDAGKDPNPHYLVVNEDEPYANKVRKLILKEEAKYLD